MDRKPIIIGGVMAKRSGKKGLGCFFYGCLTVIVVTILGAAAVFWMTKGFTNSMIEKYTAEQSIELPMDPISSEELRALEERLAEFEKASEEGREYELAMDSRELNAFINQTGRFKEIQDRVFLQIEDDEIKGRVSLPLDKVKEVPLLGAAEGRYFNGEIAIKLSLEEGGELTAHLTGLSVNGQALPERVFREIQSQNLLDSNNQGQWDSSDWESLESISVQDNQIRIRTKASPAAGESGPSAEEGVNLQGGASND